MNGIGTKLRLAREALGYSQSQIAEKTRILVQIVPSLENEDVSRIVAPIYGRGFVKLYAQAVGIDPAECIREFMDAYNGVPHEEKAVERSAPPQTPPPFVKPEEPPAVTETEILKEEQPEEPAPRRRVSRYAPPMPKDTRPSWLKSPPPFVWRIAIVAACAAIVIWAAVAGLRALYRATCTPTGEPTSAPETEVSAPAADAAPAVKAKARTPAESLPDMYAD